MFIFFNFQSRTVTSIGNEYSLKFQYTYSNFVCAKINNMTAVQTNSINIELDNIHKPVKTQLLQYSPTLDLMLFKHCYRIKAPLYGCDIKATSKQSS